MKNHVHFLGQRYQKLTQFNDVFEISWCCSWDQSYHWSLFRMKHMQMYIYINLNISCFMNLILGQPRCEIVEQIFGIFDIKKVDHASKTRCTSWCQRWGRAEKHVAHQLIHRVSLEVVTLRQSASSILWRWHSWRRRRRKLGWMDLHVLFLDGEQCLPRAYIPDVYWCMWSSLCVVVWLLLVCARFPWTCWGTRACDKWHQAGIRIVSARAESVLGVGFSKSARLIPFSTPCTRTSLLGSRHVPKNVLHLKLQQSLRNHRPNEARPKQVEKHVSCGFFVAAVKLLSFWRRNRWLCERYDFFCPGFFDVWFLAWKTQGVNWILFGHSVYFGAGKVDSSPKAWEFDCPAAVFDPRTPESQPAHCEAKAKGRAKPERAVSIQQLQVRVIKSS